MKNSLLNDISATPFFFARPPRRTTRFTDRNEQPAVKVDVHVLLACRLRDNPRFTEQRLTPGEENSPRSGKRKRSLKQVESVLKKEKKKTRQTRTPVRFPVCQKPWKKGGGETKLAFRDFHRSVRFLLVLLVRLSKDILFSRFEAREVVAPEGGIIFIIEDAGV